MASAESLAIRRQNAIERINNVTRQLGAGVEQQQVNTKDPEMAAVIHLENAAAVLEATGGLPAGNAPLEAARAGPVPGSHQRNALASHVNEFIAPKEQPVPDQQPAETAAAEADEADDETDQSEEAHARRAKRRAHAAEHKTTKK